MRTFTGLRATSLNQESHEKTCGYWYVVTERAMSHTAFATRSGLDRWLSERNLALRGELPERGTHGTVAIDGAYHDRAHTSINRFAAIRPIIATAVLSNGNYTLGLIDEDSAGVRTVHYLNPNVEARLIFDYQRTRAQMN